MAHNARDDLETRQFACGACGGQCVYAPDEGCLVCQACRQREAIKAGEQKYVPFSYEQHGGAPDETWETVTALLPFRVTAERATEIAQKWLRKEGVDQAALSGTPKAAYLPFYLFTMKGSATYRGRRGDKHTERRELRGLRDARGQTLEQTGTVTKWSGASGEVDLSHEPIPVAALEKPPNDFALKLSWPLEELRHFDEAYLAGFAARRPQLNLKAAYELAVSGATGRLEYAARNEIGGDVQEIKGLTPKFSDASFRLVLLPAYVGSFLYEGRKRPYAINGYSEEVVGDAPDTLKKKALRWLLYAGVAVVLIPVYLLWMVLNGFDLEGAIGVPILLGVMVGVFLLFMWAHNKVHFLLLALLYVLLLVGIGYGLWFLTDSSRIVTATESVLAVMGVLLLFMAYGAKEDEKAAAAKVKPKGKGRPAS